MLPKIEIRTFGTLQVIRDQHAVTESDWHTRQARQLLKILVTERPRPVSTDRLIETLWPASEPSAAATTLRSAINALRNVLEPNRPNRSPAQYIITQSPGYAFHLHPDIWLDVEEFENAIDRAHQATNAEARQALLQHAVALYIDDYLISDPYADRVQSERERLRERYFNALLELSELQALAGDYAEAISACRRILARDEVRENAYQLLMRFQTESGDSASALLTYERCRTILAEELGADPSPLTQMLHQRILNGEIVPSTLNILNHPVPGLRPGSAVISDKFTLPQSALLPLLSRQFADVFVGREEEIAQLNVQVSALLAGKGELVVLGGEAGVGKTRLAYSVLSMAAESGATVISSSCQQIERSLPFAPLADGIGRYLHALPEATLRGLPTASLTQMAQIIPSLQDLLPDLPAPINDGLSHADEHRQRLIEGIVAFLAELARLRPLLFFVDDLHWADQDTLAVLSRLAQRLANVPIFLLLAYRSDDLPENEALITLLHAFNRTEQTLSIDVKRLSLQAVQEFIISFAGDLTHDAAELAEFLYEATGGNALFVTEALRDLQERFQADESERSGELTDNWSSKYRHVLTLRHNQRVDEIVQERIERLPPPAVQVLQLCAVIGRDFSLDLLENSAGSDPVEGLEILLRRKFLHERPDERLDFSHQIVRQSVYDRINTLARRRLHRAVANALVNIRQAEKNPSEVAFHYGLAGSDALAAYGKYSVLAGEIVLKNFGFRQAIEHFNHALYAFEAMRAPEDPADQNGELVGRALLGLGLTYESLLDPDGVTDAYRRLHNWAREQGDLQLMLTAHSRLASVLELVGQQRESNELLDQLMGALIQSKVADRAIVVTDLLERRRRIYSAYEDENLNSWEAFIPPPPIPAAPVQDVLKVLAPIHAVLPLLDYGWTLRVQGQLDAATTCLTAVVQLAMETGQRSLASIAYFQLAVTARMQDDLGAQSEAK